MESLITLLKKTTAYFESKGIEHARLNAELLFAHALECKRLELYLQFERPLEEALLEKMRPWVLRRGKREPLQYILGEWPFGELTLKVDSRALIPRPETEELLAIIEEQGSTEPEQILDLGTGSGALALSLAHRYAEASVVAVDSCEKALSLAEENAQKNALEARLQFLRSDWFSELAGASFDLIVSNPPYLTEEEWEEAQPEVKAHEPLQALVAEEAGLRDLQQILEQATAHLTAGGLLAMETGILHHAALAEAASACGYARWLSCPDMSGRDRFFLAWKAS